MLQIETENVKIADFGRISFHTIRIVLFSWYTSRVVQYILYIYKSIKNIHKNFVNSVYTRVGNESLVPDFLDIPHLLCTVHDVPQDYIIPYSILRKIS